MWKINFLQLKFWSGSGSTWIRIGLASWIRIRIEIKSRIHIETNEDRQQRRSLWYNNSASPYEPSPYVISLARISTILRGKAKKCSFSLRLNPYVHSRVDFKTFIMGNPMAELILSPCRVLWIWPLFLINNEKGINVDSSISQTI